MAAQRRKSPVKKGAQREETKYHCSDCERSYDWHSKALDGHLILCRCPLKRNGGQFCIFLNDKACENFIQRTSKPDISE